MGLKATLLRPFAQRVSKSIRKSSKQAIPSQKKIFRDLIQTGKKTQFGSDHHFENIQSYDEFKQAVPIRDYENLKSYIDLILDEKKNVLWTGRPKYFAKTSGTTSGVKYIPITAESVPNHVISARNALFNYFSATGNGDFFEGKMIFLSGSPRLEKKSNIATGRLSGIINHWVPNWLKPNQMPSYKTNCIEDWEEKVDRIVTETLQEDMRMISGIPPWVQMYYERLLERTGKSSVKEIFPNFSLFAHGGVNYEPYRAKLEELVGDPVDTLETYPASEGFFAFQDQWPAQGLLLNTDSGIFFEFIPSDLIFEDNPPRFQLSEVVIGINYALIINSNAGLWGYNLGDTVEFVSTNPYRLIVTGRTKHFISAFGEHVIGKEVEHAMQTAMKDQTCSVVEFTVAPQIQVQNGSLPYHEWLIEFADPPANIKRFAEVLDGAMRDQNIYYKDLTEGKILQPAVVSSLVSGAFRNYMKKAGKLGGQNKVPRLSNDRSIADKLEVLPTQAMS